MLSSLVLEIEARQSVTLPNSLGRASQSLLYRLIGERDEALAKSIHDDLHLKPLTASNILLGRRSRDSLHVEKGDRGWLRFTGLNESVSQHLHAIAKNPPSTVELDRSSFPIVNATLDPQEHEWADASDYQTLANRYLLNTSRLPKKISIKFYAPTTFRHNNAFVPLPNPSHVFSSLFNRWQFFAPIALPDEVEQFINERIAINYHKIRSRYQQYPNKGHVVGFTGKVTFKCMTNNRYLLAVMHLLADYAFFSAIGYRTSVGMGQVQVLR